MKNERSYFDLLDGINFVDDIFDSNIDLIFFEKVR